VDTNPSKTPVTLSFADWRSLSPDAAAAEVHRRIAALPSPLRSAALAWLSPAPDLAASLSAARAAGPGALGVPYLLKDLFDVAGLPTRAGSSFLARVRPTPGDGTLVRDFRAAGAALAGKTHLVEFAAGLTGENRTYGDCPHPFRPERLSGGSSSGSAALVAAGVVPLAVGTDTGGSVRVPAAFCGVYGYRGIPGDARIADAVPLSPTCDTAGWFTARPDDLATTLDALIGPMPATGVPPRGVFLRATDLVAEALVDAACHAAAAQLATAADSATRDALLASWRDAVDAYGTVVMHDAHAVHAAWLDSERAHYDPAIWQRIHDAGDFPAEKVERARAVAARVRATFESFFVTHDFLALPCAPVPALTKAQCTPETRRAILTFTAPASLAGLPCVTVPVPLADGLTGGLQIIARDANSPVFRWVLQQYCR